MKAKYDTHFREKEGAVDVNLSPDSFPWVDLVSYQTKNDEDEEKSKRHIDCFSEVRSSWRG